MTDELEQERRALASEIEHLRIQRDELAAKAANGTTAVDPEAELRAVKAERERVKAERERIADATDQRQADLGRSARGGEYGVDHAVAAALERQRIADHTAGQDEHLATINGSIRDTAKALEDLAAQFAAAAAAQRVKETAVAQALADALKEQQEGGLTKKRLYISVVAIVLPMLLVLALTIFK
ncbi:MAG: hypothetical protein ACLP0J_28180 [Solirubrobacteraceae bacterium]